MVLNTCKIHIIFVYHKYCFACIHYVVISEMVIIHVHGIYQIIQPK
jgi:hypothetical protein